MFGRFIYKSSLSLFLFYSHGLPDSDATLAPSLHRFEVEDSIRMRRFLLD